MRRDYFDPLCILMGLGLFVAGASAQPVPPALDAGFATQAILALQQQRNAAQDSAAQASAQLALSQQKAIALEAENKSLKEQLDKAKTAAAPTTVPSEPAKEEGR